MNMKKIAAFAAVAVIAAGICTGMPASNFTDVSITAYADTKGTLSKSADGNFMIFTDDDTKEKTIAMYLGKGGDITIPADIDRIDKNVFMGNDTITSVTFPANSKCKYVGDYAFNSMPKLKKVTFKADVCGIGQMCFNGCSALEEVIFKGNVASPDSKFSVESGGELYGGIYGYAFNNCKALKTVEFAENSTVDFIGEYAFSGCDALSTVKMPKKIYTIKKYAFLGCNALNGLTIPADTWCYEYCCGYDYDYTAQKYIKNENFVITTEKGSFTEKYAKGYGIKYQEPNGTAKAVESEDLKPEVKKAAAAKNFKIKKTNNSVTLTWDKADGADMYRVYKYNEKTEKYEKYKDVKSAKCTISGLKANTKYKFKVVSYSKNDSGKYVKGESSKAVSVTTKK